MDARDEINLRVLKQHDSTILSILKQSPYVVLYSYSISEASWSKLPFEGTLFVYTTDTGACGYRILNRLSLDCFSRVLKKEEDVMETEGYVIHRDEEDIWGIWIWDSEDRTNIYAAMKEAAKVSEEASARASVKVSQSPDDHGSVDVKTLFASAAGPRTGAWTPTTIAQ